MPNKKSWSKSWGSNHSPRSCVVLVVVNDAIQFDELYKRGELEDTDGINVRGI